MGPTKRMKFLLPIKTNKGLVLQSREEADEDREIEVDSIADKDGGTDEELESGLGVAGDIDEDDEAALLGEDADAAEQLTPVEQMAQEEAKAKELKISIANYAQGAMENPQENVGHLRQLRLLLASPLCQSRPVLADYIVVSLCEVFKDILPSYKIRVATDAEKHQLARKETKRLRAFEESLLLNYKKYLAVLRDAMRRRQNSKAGSADGDAAQSAGGKWRRRKRGVDGREAGVVYANRTQAIRCLGQLLATHPYFNESQELLAWLTPCLNSRQRDVSGTVGDAFRRLFADDRRGEASLRAVKAVCRFAAAAAGKAAGVHGELLEVLACVRLDLPPPPSAASLQQQQGRGASGDSAASANAKLTHKQKLVKMSRQERKRGKASAGEVAGLEELRHQESSAVRARLQQRCAELLLHLYVRVLRARPGARPLTAALAGLARLTLRVNLDLLPDLFGALAALLDWPDLSAAHSLQVIRTAASLLSGEGDALTLDPRRFYLHLYGRLDRLVRCHPELSSQLAETLLRVLADRRRHLPPMRPVSFLRRLIVACCSGGGSVPEAALVDLLTCAARLFSAFPRAQYLLEPAEDDGEGEGDAGLAVAADPDLGGRVGGSCEPQLRRLAGGHASPRVRRLAGQLLRQDFAAIAATASSSNGSSSSSGVGQRKRKLLVGSDRIDVDGVEAVGDDDDEGGEEAASAAVSRGRGRGRGSRAVPQSTARQQQGKRRPQGQQQRRGGRGGGRGGGGGGRGGFNKRRARK